MRKPRRKEKDKVMLPLTMRAALAVLEPEEVTEIILAVFDYAAGEPPEITLPRAKRVWPTFRREIEQDDIAYYQRSLDGQWAQFSPKNPTISRAEWEIKYADEYISLAERVAAKTAPPEPPHVAQDEAEPEEDQDTADILSAALARWIAYKEYTPEQATLERPRFEALGREHGAAAVAKYVDRAISTNSQTITIEEETK